MATGNKSPCRRQSPCGREPAGMTWPELETIDSVTFCQSTHVEWPCGCHTVSWEIDSEGPMDDECGTETTLCTGPA